MRAHPHPHLFCEGQHGHHIGVPQQQQPLYLCLRTLLLLCTEHKQVRNLQAGAHRQGSR